jgi:tRNA1(Val) A37 N6-methylase TrmN6
MAEPDVAVTEDRLLGGALRLLQPRRGHRAGTDAVLLAGLPGIEQDDVVADLGAGSGAVALMAAARRPDIRLLLVERDPDLAELARRNLVLNGLGERGRLVEADLFSPREARHAAGLAPGSVDLVLTNPPFFEGEGRPSPEPRRRSAHAMEGGHLDDWIEAASDLLRGRGRIAVIYRADGLGRCLSALGKGFGSIAVTPVYPRAGEGASRVLVEASKGGRGPFRIAPPVILHGSEGAFTPQAERLHRAQT